LRTENTDLKSIVQEYEKTGSSVPDAPDTQVSPPPIMLVIEEVHAFTWFFTWGKS